MGKYLDGNGLSHLIGMIKTALSGKSDTGHVHAAGDVTSGAFDAARIPSLAISKITNLQTTLDGKADDSDLDNYLPLTGGTLSGSVQISNASNKNWSEKDTTANLALANNGYSSGTRYMEWLAYDKNSVIPGGMSVSVASGGNVQTQLRCRNIKSSDGTTVVNNNITLTAKKDGTAEVAVTIPAAWRTALGLGSLATKSSVAAGSEITGTLGKGHGGTGKTNTDTTYYGAKSLFSGTATTGTVTLSDTAANYSMLLIQYRDNDSNYSSKLIISPNGKKVVLDMVYGVSGIGNLKSRTVTISGTSITTVSGSTMDAAHNGGAGTTNHIYITQVWGWK